MNLLASDNLREITGRAEAVTRDVIAPRADEVDRSGMWPEHSMRALGEAGLLGLNVPEDLGGLGQGLTALAAITEVIGRACSSSALCYGMHCVGTAVIAAKPTAYQEDRYLRPIAEGRHVTTLSVSETGSGVHFYLPESTLERDGSDFVVRGSKQFVTNAGHADSYVVSTRASVDDAATGEFSCILVDGDAGGLRWGPPWSGIGMRGNSSRSLDLDSVRVPQANLLGEEGDQVWFVFEIIAPYFIVAMAGAYLGIAQAAFDAAADHVRRRVHQHVASPLADLELVQHTIAKLWAGIEKARLLLQHAAELGDLGQKEALVPILSSKAEVADMAVEAVNEAMTLTGGIGYREGGTLARLLRDVRAAHVMSPTTDILRSWAGRALLDRPLL